MNNFFQKELAPYADQIDKDNNFPQLRVSGLCQLTFPANIHNPPPPPLTEGETKPTCKNLSCEGCGYFLEQSNSFCDVFEIMLPALIYFQEELRPMIKS